LPVAQHFPLFSKNPHGENFEFRLTKKPTKSCQSRNISPCSAKILTVRIPHFVSPKSLRKVASRATFSLFSKISRHADNIPHQKKKK